ncbi:class I SAM-dependent methyltransferase [Phaeacidiphilus oryzae]|uniref:class I SAM-dependent methyltransferase n=1 Tax=Phaeacidiphilus oryzae TaxID=348818 RepID=UPI0005680744|nr:class I SAM-dependent methyltransferase [Phaeacidiphilus oryzae]
MTGQREARADSFGRVAGRYAAARPGYPGELFDVLAESAGRRLAGARVADIGAGTGIASAALRARGAEVVGVEPAEGMAAEFRRALPDLPLVRGDGNALPFADGIFDLVAYAQSWHWTEQRRSLPEAWRVLRPGGALALWWNTSDLGRDWIAEQHQRMARYCGVEAAPGARNLGDARAVEVAGLAGYGAVRRLIPWSRRVPAELHLANLGSHSALLVLGEERAGAFLAEERRRLAALFPDGVVEEAYVVDLLVARRPADQ